MRIIKQNYRCKCRVWRFSGDDYMVKQKDRYGYIELVCNCCHNTIGYDMSFGHLNAVITFTHTFRTKKKAYAAKRKYKKRRGNNPFTDNDVNTAPPNVYIYRR